MIHQSGMELNIVRHCNNRCAHCNLDSMSFLEFDGSRIVNKETGEKPCIFHGNGNSPIGELAKWL